MEWVRVVDGILILLMLGFSISGYRQGFVVGALSFGGFVSGALIGLQLGPLIAGPFSGGGARIAVALAVISALAVLGYTVTGWFGTRLHHEIVSPRLRSLDAAGGAAVSLVAVLTAAWLVAVPLGTSSLPWLGREVRSSAVLASIDELMPEQARALSAGLRQTFDTDGLPDAYGAMTRTGAVEVAAPDPALKGSPAVAASRQSVIKVLGNAPGCGRDITGSGFVYAHEHVMTNAHVVAGTDDVRVETPRGRLGATVVVYDPDRDLAVLHVPGLAAPALPFADRAPAAGDDAIVLGFPLGGPYHAQPARVRTRESMAGRDIYRSRDTLRDVYEVRALVRNGNSGGPLVTPAGQVLGVVFATTEDDRQTGFVLTADEAAGTARLGVDRTRGVPTGDCT